MNDNVVKISEVLSLMQSMKLQRVVPNVLGEIEGNYDFQTTTSILNIDINVKYLFMPKLLLFRINLSNKNN